MYNYPGQQPMQSQQTGYNQYGQQPQGAQGSNYGVQQQATGYPMQNGQQQTGGAPQYGYTAQPTGQGFQQLSQQQTGYIPQQQQQQVPQPQQTQQAPQQQQQQASNANDGVIPPGKQAIFQPSGQLTNNVVTLSFLSAQDKASYEQLFKSNVPAGEQALSGAAARDILMMSNLPPSTLGEVWQLADTTKSGSLVYPEFALAMYLCSLVLQGQAVPQALPENIKKEVEKGVDWIAFHVPDKSSSTSVIQGVTNSTGAQLNTSSTSTLPTTSQQTSSAFQASQTSLPRQQTGYNPAGQTQNTGYAPALQSQTTGYTPTLQAQTTGYTPTVQAQTTGYTPTVQAQTTGYTSGLQAQTTGYTPTVQAQTTGYTPTIQAQTTGYTPALQAQSTGFNSSVQPQSTGFNSQVQPQSTGYTAPLTSQTTGYAAAPLTGQTTGYAPALTAQPTGRPGEWGFINAPGALPGLDKFTTQFMPQPGQQNFTSAGLEGNAKVEWAISKEEKRIYDKIFSEWDTERKGTIGGDVAIKVLSQSGLPQHDLESIWTLSDPGNKGKLDRDEFAVAMHLIYRRLNNYPIPTRLPPELIPPSSQNFSDSVSQVKSFLRASSASNDNSLSSVSYMKNRSFKTSSNQALKKDATVFKNDDDAMVYRSSARHRSSRNKEKDAEEKPKETASTRLSLSELRKKVHEKQILLDAIDARDEEEYDHVQEIQDKDQTAIEELKQKILNVQKEINTFPPLPETSSTSKKDIERTLYSQRTKIPKLVADVRATENEIAALKLKLFTANAERNNPGSTIVGTGPNGEITESDRRKAKNRAMLKARMASLTGKSASSEGGFEEFESQFNAEAEKVNSERDRALQAMKDIEDSCDQIARDAESGLRGVTSDNLGVETHPERERTRWEDGAGVEDDVKDLIRSLKRLAPYSGPPGVDTKLTTSLPSRPTAPVSPLSSPKPAASPAVSSTRAASMATLSPRSLSPRPSTPTAPARSAEERKAFIKAEAKRRMEERMAALGISRPANRTESRTTSVSSTPPTPASPALATAASPPVPAAVAPAEPTAQFPPEDQAQPEPAPPRLFSPNPTQPLFDPASTPISPPVAAAPSIPAIFAPEPAPESTSESFENGNVSDAESNGEPDSSSDDDEDDEQFRALLRQKAEQEAKLRQMQEEKAAKKALRNANPGADQ